MGIQDIFHSWNPFKKKDEVKDLGTSTIAAPMGSRRRFSISDQTIANTAYNRIAIDCSMVELQHVKIDEKTQNQTKMKSSLIDCLTIEANIDQTGKDFIHDIVLSVLDEGVVAVVPVETDINPKNGSFDVKSLRVGKITQWYPKYVEVELYNEETGQHETVTVPKKSTAIIENPLYTVVNNTNSMLKRLIKKMAIEDSIDEDTAAGNLNLLLQFPYTIKTEAKKKEAESRIKSLEDQLRNGKYGIGYIDATEHVIQLNRALSPTIQDSIKYLSEQFYNGLGLTQNVFNGTASELEMRAYNTRTIDPIVETILAEFRRKFLTKTARTQGQTLVAYRDPFKLVPVENLAQIADTMTRDAIMSSNEVRGRLIGMAPSTSDGADDLSNPNIADVNQASAAPSTSMAAPTTGQ